MIQCSYHGHRADSILDDKAGQNIQTVTEQVKPLRIPERELGILRTLGECSVEYLLIGGHAMRFYGSDRDVDDVDILVGRSQTNAERLFVAIWHFIGHTPAFLPMELERPGKKVTFRNDGYTFDILTSVEGLDFSEAYARRKLASQGDLSLPVASKDDLLLIKQIAAHRAPERRDLELKDIAVLRSLRDD